MPTAWGLEYFIVRYFFFDIGSFLVGLAIGLWIGKVVEERKRRRRKRRRRRRIR